MSRNLSSKEHSHHSILPETTAVPPKNDAAAVPSSRPVLGHAAGFDLVYSPFRLFFQALYLSSHLSCRRQQTFWALSTMHHIVKTDRARYTKMTFGQLHVEYKTRL